MMSNGFLELELLDKENARACADAAGTDKYQQKKILCEFRNHYSFIRRQVHVIYYIVVKIAITVAKISCGFIKW